MKNNRQTLLIRADTLRLWKQKMR